MHMFWSKNTTLPNLYVETLTYSIIEHKTVMVSFVILTQSRITCEKILREYPWEIILILLTDIGRPANY